MLWKEVSFFKRRICTIIECVKCNFDDTKNDRCTEENVHIKKLYFRVV